MFDVATLNKAVTMAKAAVLILQRDVSLQQEQQEQQEQRRNHMAERTLGEDGRQLFRVSSAGTSEGDEDPLDPLDLLAASAPGRRGGNSRASVPNVLSSVSKGVSLEEGKEEDGGRWRKKYGSWKVPGDRHACLGLID